MRYFMGIDGGATKTKAVIINESSQIVAAVIGGPVNYHQGGEKKTKKNLEEVTNNALISARLTINNLSFVVIGLAGFDTRIDKDNLTRLAQDSFGGGLKEKMEVVSDVEIAFKSCIDIDYGIVIISGTGANCFGKGKNGEMAWAGDWGWLLGDQSSGFALGLGALKRTIRDFDGRGEKTVLTKLVLKRLNMKEASELVHWVYKKDIPVAEVAGLAPLVFQAYKMNDLVAQSLVNKTVAEMAISIETVAKKVHLVSEEFTIGLVGGVFKEKIVVELLDKRIQQVLLKAMLVLPKMEPALAAAYMGQELAETVLSK